MLIGLAQILTLLVLAASSRAEERYSESLEIQPLSRNEVLSIFEFEMFQPRNVAEEWDLHEYTIFPRSLGQIIDQSDTKELHLRFGQGRWDAEGWGSPPSMGAQIGGIGVEVWAWVGGETAEEAWKNWRRLVHSLGGYFCASINFIDETQTSFPSEHVLKPLSKNLGKAWLLRGTLPAEPICTENLTPFLKLLPCQGKAGIASLLDGHTLFSSQWQTMSVDIWQSSDDSVTLHQTVANVVNTDLSTSDPLPWHIPQDKLLCDREKPWSSDFTCFPVNSKSSHFTLDQIFGRGIQGHCPFAPTDKPLIKVKAPENWLVSGSSKQREFVLDGDYNSTLNLEISSDDNSRVHGKTTPLLLVDRSFSGWGQQKGGIRTVFTNTESFTIHTAYLETLPWFMRLYLHTTVTNGNGTITSTNYSPSKDRERPSQLEFGIYLPPHGVLEIEYAFDKSLLFLEEYPPDANHGFEVPPGLAVASTPMGIYETRTSSLLLSLPVPDFSMPYNVIILTSTVMALTFGTIFNLIVREVVKETDLPPRKKPLSKLKDKIASYFR